MKNKWRLKPQTVWIIRSTVFPFLFGAHRTRRELAMTINKYGADPKNFTLIRVRVEEA